MKVKKTLQFSICLCGIIISFVVFLRLFFTFNIAFSSFGLLGIPLQPEVWLIPAFLIIYFLPWKKHFCTSTIYYLILAITCGFIVWVIWPVTYNPFSILLEYFGPYLIIYIFFIFVLFAQNKKIISKIIIYSTGIIICNIFIYIFHSISGYLFFEYENKSYISPWLFSFIWNLFYCLLGTFIEIFIINYLYILQK